ncbi:SDR family oxidoreductase [Rhizobium sp. C4]|uniref:SDR family oxidoreductase n=1 Tax=Rhizobium sp. C4 TaxID=1349800 RepID=UPI001E442348|nr:NAD(P)-dependent oxidoreductase [Rhizobium sp. C4]MCD2174853.1 NAD(P)-dependent oxidoreductase [Rhizobium sp. C4]
MTGSLKDKTLFITGGSRGIGREIALRAAADGANVVIAAKTSEPHPKLPGTIHSTVAEIEAAGGRGLALMLDVRDADAVEAALAEAANHFGGIDALINNAGAISLTPLSETSVKRFDLMMQINARAVFVTARAALPHLKKSANPHILSLSPPLNFGTQWLKPYIPYTVTKYAMTIMSLGLAEELRADGIAVNTLWPKTTIATAAVEHEVDASLLARSRTPAIMADAAHAILTSPAAGYTGQSTIDEDVLRARGVTDFTAYSIDRQVEELALDLYVDP